MPELPIFALELPTLTTHLNYPLFILRWVVHILAGGIEDIGFGGEFRMRFFFVSVKTGRKVANLPHPRVGKPMRIYFANKMSLIFK